MLEKISCPGCGASNFEKLKTGKYLCNYCNSVFSDSNNPKSNYRNLDSKSYTDKKVQGDMISGLKFAVHKKLVVNGDMNTISLSNNLTPDMIHVSNLEISGDMNVLTVVLLDGATFKNHGDMNTFKN